MEAWPPVRVRLGGDASTPPLEAPRRALNALRRNGSLVVTVADDGIGGAAPRRGSGLAGLRDRVAAHGGTLEIASPRGGGTRIEVTLPCES